MNQPLFIIEDFTHFHYEIKGSTEMAALPFKQEGTTGKLQTILKS
jgi:hypothetical protein